MRPPKLVLAAVFACAAQAVSADDDSFQGALQRGATVHPSQYSFADLYRASIAGPASSVFPVQTQQAPMRVATAQAPAEFSVAERREPQLGLLLLSGIAAAIWVARRRMGYGL